MWDSNQQKYFPGYVSPNQYQEIPSSNNYNSSVPVDSLDWPFLDNIDPALCSTKEYRHILKEISRTFVRSTIINLGSTERTIKLLRILQIIISTLSSKIDKYTDENQDLRNKYRILHKKYENARHKPNQVQNIIADRCPICQNPFKTLQYLDLHIFSKHKEVSTLWQAIRTPQPPGAFAFPWQKSHSITSTVYPQSTQNLNDQSVQNFLDDFRKKFSNEKKESDKQMKEWIDKKMNKVESKIDTLQQTAKKEIDNLKIDDRHKNRNHHRKKNRKNKNHQNEFDTQNPFNPPNQQHQQQMFQQHQPQIFQPQQPQQQQQIFQQQPQQIIQNQPQQIIQNQPQQIIQNQPQQIIQNQPIHKEDDEQIPQIKVYDNNDDENDHQKSTQNSESGSFIPLDQTSNANFISPQPKNVASGSDAEYFSPPSYDDFNEDQNPIQSPTKKKINGSQNSTNSHISGAIEDFNRSQNSDIIPKRNADLNRSQNSDLSINKNSDIIPKQNYDFNDDQNSDIIPQKNAGFNNSENSDFIPKRNAGFNNSENSDIIPKRNEGFNNDHESGEISQQNSGFNRSQNSDYLPKQNSDFNHPSSELEVRPNNKANAQFYNKPDKYSYSYSDNDENQNNFNISYVQPNDEDNEDDFYVKSDESDPYKKQLNKFNSSEIIRAEPPPGKSKLRHSSSAEDTIPQIKRNSNINDHKEIDNDYSFYSGEKINKHIDSNKELLNYHNYDDEEDNEFIEKVDDGVIDSGFSMDSTPHPDLPEFSDSPSGKQQPRFGKKSNNNPPQKFRKDNYKRNDNQHEDLLYVYNGIHHSTSDGF